jgi:hypothetical protein
MGVKDPRVILAAQDCFLAAVFTFGGTLATGAYDWIREDIPQVKPNFKDLARRYGLKFRKKDEVAADELWERTATANRIEPPPPARV